MQQILKGLAVIITGILIGAAWIGFLVEALTAIGTALSGGLAVFAVLSTCGIGFVIGLVILGTCIGIWEEWVE